VNLGQGAAIQTGVEYARRQPGATVFGTFDADGQHRLSDLQTMVERLGRGDVDVVIGSRLLLIAAVLSLLVYLLRSRTNAKAKAWVKVGYTVFAITAVYAILRPADTTVLANLLGVDRGADLLTYALVIAFLFTTLSTYLRFKELEVRYARLVRAVALQNARAPEH
jgi:hypothetical protein